MQYIPSYFSLKTTQVVIAKEVLHAPPISTARNRITATGYAYDANGSLTQDAAGQRFAYDAESHKKKFFGASNSTTAPDATYPYDGEGKRVKKISPAETTVFVYDAGGQLVAEYSNNVAAAASQAQVSYPIWSNLYE